MTSQIAEAIVPLRVRFPNAEIIGPSETDADEHANVPPAREERPPEPFSPPKQGNGPPRLPRAIKFDSPEEAKAFADALGQGIVDEDPFWVAVSERIPPRPADPSLWPLWNRIARPIADTMWGEQTGGGTETPSITSLSTEEFLTHTFANKKELVEGLLPGTGLAATIASPKVGKTAFGMQQAICIGAGIPFMGHEVEQGRVLFIEEEGSPASLQYRFNRMIEAFEHEYQKPIRPDVRWVLRQQTNIATEDGINRVRTIIEEHKPRLVIWGPLSMIGHLTNENDAAEMQRAMRSLLGLTADYDFTINVAHHRRKPSKDGAPNGVSEWFDTIRGSSALLGALDMPIGLERKVEDEYGRLYVMPRDGAPRIMGYRFDPHTLLHSAEDIVPKIEDKAPLLEVRALLRQRGRLLAKDVEAAFGVSLNTAKNRLDDLVEKEWAARLDDGPRGTKAYVPRNYEQPPLALANGRTLNEELDDIFDVQNH